MSWLAILRLGLVNACLGAVVALVTFTLNRVMAVELALPAIVPGVLVALHYAVQLLRPGLGFGGDVGGRRTPWIVGGLALLCAGGLLAAVGVALMAAHPVGGAALASAAYAAVGVGVGAVGTSSLALMAVEVAPSRRPVAATAFWLLMIVGAVLAAGVSARMLQPFSLAALVRLATGLTGLAFLVGLASVLGVEKASGSFLQKRTKKLLNPKFVGPFFQKGTAVFPALAEIWREPAARRFTVFVFTAMLAYSAQELILEPFAGTVFGLDPAHTAALTGLHQAGVLAGMLLVAFAGSLIDAGRPRMMRVFAIGGCVASAACLAGLACAGLVGPAWPLRASMAILGVANGIFAVSAIGAMLGLASHGRDGRAGTRMGLWGAAQAAAMGLGGLLSTGASDVARLAIGSAAPAYALVFLCQAGLFLAAARLAASVFDDGSQAAARPDRAFRAAAA